MRFSDSFNFNQLKLAALPCAVHRPSKSPFFNGLLGNLRSSRGFLGLGENDTAVGVSPLADMWSELEAYLNSPDCTPEKGILKAEYLGEYRLEIWFERDKDVSIYELDFLPLLKEKASGEAFSPLLDKERFSQVVGRYNLTWFDPDTGEYNENAIDISPEAIKWFCNKFGELVKA